MAQLAPDPMSAADVVNAAIATLALLLGVRSEWRAHRSGKIQLRVLPMLSYPFNVSALRSPCVCIEVANLGSFAVTIDEVGFTREDSEDRFAVAAPITSDGKPWPRRLEPHEIVHAYIFEDAHFKAALPHLKEAYAETSTRFQVTGSSKAFKRLKKLGGIPPLGRLVKSTMSGTINVTE